jgi:hypothetical protein
MENLRIVQHDKLPVLAGRLASDALWAVITGAAFLGLSLVFSARRLLPW